MAKSSKKLLSNLNFLANLKFKKFSKSLKRIRGFCFSDNFPRFSFSGICANKGLRLLPQQLEAVRRVLKRTLKKRGNLLIYACVNFAPTRKPNETRMGKGKGLPKFSVSCVRQFQIIAEITNFKLFSLAALSHKAFKKSGTNLKLITRFWEL